MNNDIERVEVDIGASWNGNDAMQNVERGQAGLMAMRAVQNAAERAKGGGGTDRLPGEPRPGLSLMRGWGMTQQARINPLDGNRPDIDEDAQVGGRSGRDMSLDLRADLDDDNSESLDDPNALRLPPPSSFSDALGGQLRYADRMDAAKQGSWRFFLLFVFSLALTIFCVYVMTIVLQYLYGISVINWTAPLRIVTVANMAVFDKDRLKVTSSQMVPFSVQSSNPISFRTLLAGTSTANIGLYLGVQKDASTFVESASMISTVKQELKMGSVGDIRMSAGSAAMYLDQTSLTAGCDWGTSTPKTTNCLFINGTTQLGSQSNHKTVIKGDASVAGKLIANHMQILGTLDLTNTTFSFDTRYNNNQVHNLTLANLYVKTITYETRELSLLNAVKVGTRTVRIHSSIHVA